MIRVKFHRSSDTFDSGITLHTFKDLSLQTFREYLLRGSLQWGGSPWEHRSWISRCDLSYQDTSYEMSLNIGIPRNYFLVYIRDAYLRDQERRYVIPFNTLDTNIISFKRALRDKLHDLFTAFIQEIRE